MAGRSQVAGGPGHSYSSPQPSHATAGSGVAESGGWTQYVGTWLSADVALPSTSGRQSYALGRVAGTLKVTLLDGCRPNTALDLRCSELSTLAPAPVQRKSNARIPPTPVAPSVVLRPIAAAFAPAIRADEAETLLVLLSTGHLLAVDSVHLGIEAVLGIFPEVLDGRGRYLPGSSLLAVMPELGHAVVVSGTQLGFAAYDPEDGVGSNDKPQKPFDLPKGCFGIFVLAYPSDDTLLLVGCSGGKLLLYSGSKDYKKNAMPVTLTRVQSLDMAAASGGGPRGSLQLAGSAVRQFLRRPTLAAGATANNDLCFSDAFVLGGEEERPDLLAAGGGTLSKDGVLTVWQVIKTVWRDKKPEPCRLKAHGKCPRPVLRVLLLASGRAGSAWPLLLALDEKGDMLFWAVEEEQLSLMNTISARPSPPCKWEPAAAATFALTGALYLLVGVGSEDSLHVGWLDLAALLFKCGRAKGGIVPPLGDQTTTCLGPPLAMQGGPGGVAEVPGGGEVFFVSESRLQHYRAINGRTAEVRIGANNWRAMSILSVFPAQSNTVPTHLLLSVLDGLVRAVWLVSVTGEIVRRLRGAFDAAMLGSGARARIVWLSCNESDQCVTAFVAPAFPGAAPDAPGPSLRVPGVEHVISGPVFGGQQLLLYWGSQLQGGPLHFSVAADVGVPQLGREVVNSLPSFGPATFQEPSAKMHMPAELLSWRWDCPNEGPSSLALASMFIVWVVRFTDAGRASANPRASLLAWVDLQGCFAGAGRALSLAWLRPPPLASEGMPGVLLISTLWGVLYWSLVPGQIPACIILCDRPQLLAGVLLDRLLCLEVQGNVRIFGGVDRLKEPKMQPGPRARVRARLVNLLEAAVSRGSRATPANRKEACAAVRDSDWRVVSSRLPESLPDDTVTSLWPIVSSPDSPPQLSQAAFSFYHIASTARDEFKALVAIVSGLQSGGVSAARRRATNAGSNAEERSAIQKVEDAVLRNRIDPSRADFLGCASRLLLDCMSSACASKKKQDMAAFALTSRGLAKHDLLPFGMLLAGVLRGILQGNDVTHHLALPLENSMGDNEQYWPWSWPLRMPAPMVASLLMRCRGRDTTSEAMSSLSETDFSAAALLQQRFSELPAVRRPAGLCQLHTATIMQWLGLRSTQMQVQNLKAIQQAADGYPGSGSFGPQGSDAGIRSPPTILANGILVYWRCADGQGSAVRDSAGCFRFGRLAGTTDWQGPLVANEPMEFADEWGSTLAPNFGIGFGQGGSLTYTPADGASGEDDRSMLALVGGADSGGGLRHLKKAREEAKRGRGSDDESDEEEPQSGWTVELWARLSGQERGEVVLFGRPVANGNLTSAPLLWSYVRSPPGFVVRSSGRDVLNGKLETHEFATGTWTHLALRCSTSGIEMLADQQVLGSTRTRLPAVPAATGLHFGDQGLELTEIRVWGVFRTNMELQEPRQPLPNLLNDERKTLKVRYRGSADLAQGPELTTGGSGFGLTQLVAPASRNTRRQTAATPSEKPSPAKEQDSGFSFEAAGEGFGDWGTDPFPPWPPEDSHPWPQPTTTPAHEEPAHEEPVLIPELPIPAPPVVEIPKAPSKEPSEASAEVEPPTILPRVRRLAEHDKIYPKGTRRQTDCCMSCGAILMKDMKFCRKCGHKVNAKDEQKKAESDDTESLPGHTEVVTTLCSTAKPGERVLRVESIVGFREGDDILIGGIEHNSIAAFGSIMLYKPLIYAHTFGTKITKIQKVGKLPERPPPIEAFTFLDGLPRPGANEQRSVENADHKLFAAVHALDSHSYPLATSNFRATLVNLARQLPERNHGGSFYDMSAAMRSRMEAASAYTALSILLHRCEDLRGKVAARCNRNLGPGDLAYAQVDPGLLRQLCTCWACVLRVAKAPKHTVRYAVQGMAIFFTMAKSIGGWSAAAQVASALLGSCREMLTDGELKQVEYVAQAAAVGRVARGASDGSACGDCPRCRHPLEPLAPSCGYCFAEIVVCFREFRLCDGRRALYCDVCSAAYSAPRGSNQSDWSTPSQRSIRMNGGLSRHWCAICGVGQLRPKYGANDSDTLAF